MTTAIREVKAGSRVRDGADTARAVIFDLGGVVLDWRPLDLLQRFYAGEADDVRERVRRSVFEHPDWLDLDRGTLSHAQAVPRFAAGVPLYCLSNMHAEIAAWLLRTHDFWPVFRGVVFSADERLIKPEAEIFERLLRRHGLSAARTAFVDDQPANIAAARALGLHAVAFEDAAQWRDALHDWLGDRWRDDPT